MSNCLFHVYSDRLASVAVCHSFLSAWHKFCWILCMLRCCDFCSPTNSWLVGRACEWYLNGWCSHAPDTEICCEVCLTRPALVYVHCLWSSEQMSRVPNRNFGAVSWRGVFDSPPDPRDIPSLDPLSEELRWFSKVDCLLVVQLLC